MSVSFLIAVINISSQFDKSLALFKKKDEIYQKEY